MYLPPKSVRRFGVADIVPLAERDEEQCLRLAAALESQSEHPIVKGVARAAAERKLTLPPASDFKNLTGRGARARVEGTSCSS